MRRILLLGVSVFLSMAVIFELVSVAVMTEHNAAAATREAENEEGAYRLVAPLDVIMGVEEDMFEAILEKVDGKKFKTVKKYALFVAELSNVSIHAEYEEVDTDTEREEWENYAKTGRDSLLEMAKAAKKKDVETIKALHLKVNESCESCHEKFRD